MWKQTYIELLEQRYLPSLMNGLIRDLNIAPPESEEKLAVLRVMRMLEDKSGRNNEAVKQYMARRWSNKFHGQRDIQAQLMVHLDYALSTPTGTRSVKRATVTPSAAGRHMINPMVISAERTEKTADIPAGLPEPAHQSIKRVSCRFQFA